MKQYRPIKKTMNEKELNLKIERLADMITDALIEESRVRVLRRIQPNRNSPEAA